MEVNVSSTDGGELRARCKVPSAVLEAQREKASVEATPVISFVGPTGAGKSFLVSGCMSRAGTDPDKWPAVAKADQTVPTSSHAASIGVV